MNDEVKFLNGTTDVAKMKPDVYEEAFENSIQIFDKELMTGRGK